VALSDKAVADMAAEMIGELNASNAKDGHHGLIRRYLEGDQDLPYCPEGATDEFYALAKKSITNWLPLIVSTFVKALWVDGYRPGDAVENVEAWEWWQLNGLDAWQSVATRGALEYGAAYVRVLPGDKGPQIKPLRADRTLGFYEDDDAEWPVRGIEHAGTTLDDEQIYRVYDDTTVYTVIETKKKTRNGTKTELVVRNREAHGLGVCPLVRFRPRLGGDSPGIVRPLLTLQDRINNAVFLLLIALQYASFRQRWATGLAIPNDTREMIEVDNPDYDPNQPEDEDTNPPKVLIPNPDFGKPIESFEAAIERLWTSNSTETKFGEFSQTDTNKHLEAYNSAVRTLLALAEVPPMVLMGEIQNVSADALASLYDATTRLLDMYKKIFGESWEQVFRLATRAAGKGEGDVKAQVFWKSTETRSLAATVDAITKMVQMANMPDEAAWEMFPGLTDQDIKRMRLMLKAQRAEEDRRAAEALKRQQDAQPAEPAGDAPAPPKAPTTKAKAPAKAKATA
jgi:hypothetical protein